MVLLGVASMAPQSVPDEQRLHYNELLEQVHKLTSDLEPKLPMYLAFLKNEEMIRKCVATVSLCLFEAGCFFHCRPLSGIDGGKTKAAAFNLVASIYRHLPNSP